MKNCFELVLNGGNGHFMFKKGGHRLFMVFEKACRLSRFWKNGDEKDFRNGHFTFEKGCSDF